MIVNGPKLTKEYIWNFEFKSKTPYLVQEVLLTCKNACTLASLGILSQI